MKIWEVNLKTFGRDLKELRLDAQLTQNQLGVKVGFCNGYTISNWEKGEGFPNFEKIPRLMKALGIDEMRIYYK